jgi:hypothetical protein
MGESKKDGICWVLKGESETSDLSGLKVSNMPKGKNLTMQGGTK